MIYFSQRLKLDELCQQWMKEERIPDCAFNAISFLVANGLLNEDKVRDYLKGKIENSITVLKRNSISPFNNDPFSLIWVAFNNLYPDKEFEAYWDPFELKDEEGKKVIGTTHFGDDGIVTVFVSTDISIENAAETFAHELAHVAVGAEHNHNELWEDAFEAIHQEYERICNEKFPNTETICDEDGNEILEHKIGEDHG